MVVEQERNAQNIVCFHYTQNLSKKHKQLFRILVYISESEVITKDLGQLKIKNQKR